MQVLLEIKDSKAEFVLELLKNFSFVKAKQMSALSAKNSFKKKQVTSKETLENIKEGLEEVKLFKKGKLKTTSAKDFLNEI